MFELNEQELMMEKVLRDFMTNEVEPHVPAMERDELQPYQLGRKLYETLGIQEQVRKTTLKKIEQKRDEEINGGSSNKKAAAKNANPMMGMLVSKEMSRVSPGFCLSIGASTGLYGGTVMAKGTADQIEQYALPVLTMEKVGAWGMTEPDSGSDAFACKTTARRDGDYYILNGSKTFITNAPYADFIVVYAKMSDGKSSTADKRLVFPFIIESGMEGVTLGKPLDKMGMCGSPTGEIFLDNVRVPKNMLLGDEEQSSREQAKQTLQGERSGMPGMAWGIIERCYDECVAYTLQRQQFGKPIAEFQLIQERLAKMYVHLETVKNTCFKLAWMQKTGKGNWQSASAAKYLCTSIATQVGMDAVQLMGGFGYMKEAKVERLARDAKLLEIGGGTNDILLLNIAKGILLDKGFHIQIDQSSAEFL